MNIFRNQHSFLANEENDGVVRNHFLQADGNNRKRLLQAQGVSERLSKLKEQLSFLARRNDGSQEGGCPDFRLIRYLRETGGGSNQTVHPGSDVQAPSFGFHVVDHYFQFNIAALHDLHNTRIETAPFLCTERTHGLLRRQCPPIRPLGSQGFEAIHGRKDSRADGYGFAFQAVGISGAVPFFVMGAHDRNNGIRKFNAIQDLRSDDRMDFHFLELFRSEASRLGENVLGDRELTNVVQHRGRANGMQHSVVQPQVLGNLNRINLHAAQMIVGGVILCFNREGECFDSSQMQGRNLLGVLLLRIQTAEVSLVRAVDPINDRENEKRDLPAKQPVDKTDTTSNQRTQQIIREGPQIAFLPDVDWIAALGHGDDAGDGDGIEGEVGGSRG